CIRFRCRSGDYHFVPGAASPARLGCEIALSGCPSRAVLLRSFWMDRWLLVAFVGERRVLLAWHVQAWPVVWHHFVVFGSGRAAWRLAIVFSIPRLLVCRHLDCTRPAGTIFRRIFLRVIYDACSDIVGKPQINRTGRPYGAFALAPGPPIRHPRHTTSLRPLPALSGQTIFTCFALQ